MQINQAFGKFPDLASEQLLLRQITAEHLDDVYRIYSDDTVFEYCGIIPKHNQATVKSMIGHFERDYLKKTRIKWGIFTQDEPDRLVGIAEAMEWNSKVNMVTIGYFLARDHWGRGIATEAVQVLVKYLFEVVEVNRIQAEVMPANEASKQVLLKNGFIREGLLRQASVWSGKGIVDLEIYGLLRADVQEA
ncbi:GNAT family protein [Paenibacillus sp. JX-17]|uniref:GNAT family protein n=1 Tax=Paenibacillus lacisoli TaxID=3064525 RepID=A0ABT9CH80_9BACL|nr:GNAT family protein [Paenibacillus sp. JX-17]MDO7908643.1 GNAT family protein [Paenibacillus sp. JX-17]